MKVSSEGDWDDWPPRREPVVEKKKPAAPLSTFEKLKALFINRESTISFPKK